MITDRDMEVLKMIDHYIEENGYAPSLKDIADSLYMSKSCAQKHIGKLIAFDLVRATPRTARSYRINK